MVKSLLSLETFVNNKKKQKYCSTCASLATMEAQFDVGEGVIIIERYCEACSKKITPGK